MGSTRKGLRVEETVRLNERALGYHSIVVPLGEPGFEVVEVGPEHAVLGDTAAGVETRLPLYLTDSIDAAAGAVQPAA